MEKQSEKIVTTATVDEALEKTHFGKFNRRLIVFSGLVLNNVVLESVGISFALPVVACDLKLSYQEQGILGAVCFLGIIVSSHLWGFLADTKGRKAIMKPTLLLAFLVTVVSSFSYNFLMMAVLRFVNGILISAVSATIFAYLGEFHCLKVRNRAILSGALICAASAIFLPIIAWIFINQEWQFYIPYLAITYKPWRLYFLVCGFSGLGCYIFLSYLPESPKYLLGVNKIEEALEVLKIMHHKNTQGNENLKDDEFTITTLLPDLDTPARKKSLHEDSSSIYSILRLIWQQTAPIFSEKHIRKTGLAASIQFIIFYTAHGVFMWFPYILNNVMLYTKNFDEPLGMCDILRVTQSSNFKLQNHLNETKQDMTCTTKLELSTYRHTITLELTFVTVLICVIFALRKFKRTPVLFTILSFCGTCGILSLLVKIPLVSIYLLVLTLCCGVATSVMNTIVVDIYPTNLRAMAVCISLMLGRIGSVAGSNVMGALIETHCEIALYSSSTALIVAACLGILMPKTQVDKKPANNVDTI